MNEVYRPATIEFNKGIYITLGQVWSLYSHESPIVITDVGYNSELPNTFFGNKITGFPHTPHISYFPGTERLQDLKELLGVLNCDEIVEGIVRRNKNTSIIGVQKLYSDCWQQQERVFPYQSLY